MPEQNSQTDPAAILREALERYQGAMTTLARRRTRKTLALFCHQHLPALLSELDQSRRILASLRGVDASSPEGIAAIEAVGGKQP